MPGIDVTRRERDITHLHKSTCVSSPMKVYLEGKFTGNKMILVSDMKAIVLFNTGLPNHKRSWMGAVCFYK